MHKFCLPLLLAAVASAQDPDGKASARADAATPPVQAGGDGGGSLNTRLVRHWHRAAGVGYNDIWGSTTPDGRELCYVGEQAGIWIVETTDPTNIRQLGWFSAPNSVWRDFAHLGHYVYAVSDGHRGIRIIDVSNPDNPVDLGTVQTSAIRNTHNITADPATGHLYLSGTNQGLALIAASYLALNRGLRRLVILGG